MTAPAETFKFPPPEATLIAAAVILPSVKLPAVVPAVKVVAADPPIVPLMVLWHTLTLLLLVAVVPLPLVRIPVPETEIAAVLFIANTAPAMREPLLAIVNAPLVLFCTDTLLL